MGKNEETPEPASYKERHAFGEFSVEYDDSDQTYTIWWGATHYLVAFPDGKLMAGKHGERIVETSIAALRTKGQDHE